MRDKSEKPYHHGDLRNTLIEVGLELLEENGSAALDLRKVARKAGVSHAAPYRHFADKQALIAALREEGFVRLAARINAALEQSPDDPLEQLQSVALAYVQFAQQNPWLMRDMFSGLTLERDAFPEVITASKVVFKLYIQVIENGQAQGKIVAGNAGALAGVLWSLLHGIAILIIEDQITAYAPGADGTERLVRFGLQTLYAGLEP